MTCCQFATDAEIEAEPELFQCEDCQYRIEKAKLAQADTEALALYQRLASRVVQDLHLTPLVFDIARLRVSEEEADELFERLNLIHETLKPPEQAASRRDDVAAD